MSYSLKNLVAGNEAFGGRFEDEEGTSVSIEQKIEVETEVAEEMEEQAEVVEVAEEGEETAEAAEEMMATFEYAERMASVVEQCGWSRPVALAFNYGQGNGQLGEVEEGFGITLAANESLEMVASPNDANSIAVMEGFKDTMKKFWEWIKKIAKKIWEGIKSIGSKIMAFFTSVEKTSKRLALALKDVTGIDAEKAKDKKFKVLTKMQYVAMVANLNTVFGAFGNIEADGSFKAMKFETLGFEITADNEFKITDKDPFEGIKEQSFSGDSLSGWTLGDVQNNKPIVDLISAGRKVERALAGMKKLGGKLESDANKYSKAYSDDASAKAAKDARDEAKKGVKTLTSAQKLCSKAIKFSVQLAKQYIKVQRAFLACKK